MDGLPSKLLRNEGQALHSRGSMLLGALFLAGCASQQPPGSSTRNSGPVAGGSSYQAVISSTEVYRETMTRAQVHSWIERVLLDQNATVPMAEFVDSRLRNQLSAEGRGFFDAEFNPSGCDGLVYCNGLTFPELVFLISAGKIAIVELIDHVGDESPTRYSFNHPYSSTVTTNGLMRGEIVAYVIEAIRRQNAFFTREFSDGFGGDSAERRIRLRAVAAEYRSWWDAYTREAAVFDDNILWDWKLDESQPAQFFKVLQQAPAIPSR